jgi:hypothetical protein
MTSIISYENGVKRQLSKEAIEQQTRLAKIKNMLRNVELNAPIWIQLQQSLYPNNISLSPNPTIEEVLINNRNESELGSGDFSRETFLHNISSISSPEIAEYVIERITPEEIKATNQGFDILKVNLKKLTKRFIKRQSCNLYYG